MAPAIETQISFSFFFAVKKQNWTSIFVSLFFPPGRKRNSNSLITPIPQVLLFCLKSVSWTGNELVGDDVENCENFQLTLTNLSHSFNFVSISVEILLKLWPIAMYSYLQQVLPRVVIYRTQVAKNKLEVASTVQPYEGEPRASNEDFDEDFDEDWQRRFLACGFQVKKRTKKSLYWIFSLLRLCFVSMAKSMLRMGSVFVSVAIPFHSFALSAAKVPLARCSRVSLLSSNSHSKPKRTFDERISCITRHDDFSPRSHRAVSMQVALFPGECKDRGYRCRAGQTENKWIHSNLIQVNLKEGF